MNIETIERNFKEKVCEKLRLSSEGVNRYRVFTPFMFEDGDHLSIILWRGTLLTELNYSEIEVRCHP